MNCFTAKFFSFPTRGEQSFRNVLRRFWKNFDKILQNLSKALGMEALRHKFSTYYINCHKLIAQLNKAHYENQLETKIKKLSSYRVLIIDEIGYLPLDKQGSNLFFQLISKRYEKNSTIITSNRGFAEWGEIFGDNIIASAILDRLLHHCTVVNINGNSYRLKDRKKVFNHTRKELDK